MSEDFPNHFNNPPNDSENSELLFEEGSQEEAFFPQQPQFGQFEGEQQFRPPTQQFEEMPQMPNYIPQAPVVPVPQGQVTTHMMQPPAPKFEEPKENYDEILNPSQPHKEPSKAEYYKMIADKIKAGEVHAALEIMGKWVITQMLKGSTLELTSTRISTTTLYFSQL